MQNDKFLSYIHNIIEEYYALIRLELDYFKFIVLCDGIPFKNGVLHLSTSGKPELINKRHKILFESFYSQKKIICDSYFLKLANLFELSKRNKPISIPILIDELYKNLNSLPRKEIIEQLIEEYSTKANSLNNLIIIVREHRNKCLAHNDPKIKQCNHLNNISTNDTRVLMDFVKFMINSLGEYFKTPRINEELISKMRSENFLSNHNLIEGLEK